MKKIIIYIIIVIFNTNCKKDNSNNLNNEQKKLQTIAFGSCSSQWEEMPIFKTIHDLKPDLYIALGDNMYSDVVELVDFPLYPYFINFSYKLLETKKYFKEFKENIPIIATWDDHDYGYNNGGKEFPYKNESKDLFMKFWNVPQNSGMRNRQGVYESYYYGDDLHKVQIIMLDTRWFLDVISDEPILPTADTSKHILGEEEWQWLEQELRKPARIRIIGSSTQFATEHNGYETWSNYPHEMNRFFNLIKSTRAEGLFFISGDVHYAEISRRNITDLYPLYDITSSGLTELEGASKPNQYRIGNSFLDYNFGVIEINWNNNPIIITQKIYNIDGEIAVQNVININELKF